VYDMYPWDQPAEASEEFTEAVHAVQVALDRRDNGGDAGVRPGPGACTSQRARTRPRAPTGARAATGARAPAQAGR